MTHDTRHAADKKKTHLLRLVLFLDDLLAFLDVHSENIGGHLELLDLVEGVLFLNFLCVSQS